MYSWENSIVDSLQNIESKKSNGMLTAPFSVPETSWYRPTARPGSVLSVRPHTMPGVRRWACSITDIQLGCAGRKNAYWVSTLVRRS